MTPGAFLLHVQLMDVRAGPPCLFRGLRTSQVPFEAGVQVHRPALWTALPTPLRTEGAWVLCCVSPSHLRGLDTRGPGTPHRQRPHVSSPSQVSSLREKGLDPCPVACCPTCLPWPAAPWKLGARCRLLAGFGSCPLGPLTPTPAKSCTLNL